MTVHGAKGLQAPLVILPDTTALPPDDPPLLWAKDSAGGPAVPIWAPRKELRCAASDALRAAATARREEEHNRLLYVALTRAEDRLVVCGWQPKRALPDGCWYQLIARGFARLDAEAAPSRLPWEGPVLRHACPQMRPPVPDAAAGGAARAAPLPPWAGRAPGWGPMPPPREETPPSPLAPSRPEGAGAGPVPQAASPLAARAAPAERFRRGQVAHALLQHLPALPPNERRAAAERYLAPLGLPGLAEEVMAVLEHPELAPLFGPEARAEVPLTGVIGSVVVGGLVDRLAVLPDRVLVADYKTNRSPPALIEDTPVLYLRQMAAYREVLRGALPGRPVTCALVWTAAARVMTLPDSLLDGHAPGAG
jgi:ATP-dependent helicase/nuclease subunit A